MHPPRHRRRTLRFGQSPTPSECGSSHSHAAPADIPQRTRAAVEGGVSSMASVIAARRFAISARRPQQRATLRDQIALRRRPAPWRRRAIAAAASAARCSRFFRLRAARDAAPRPYRAREHPRRHCPVPTRRETGWHRRGGRRSTGDGPPRTRSPRREKTVRSSSAAHHLAPRPRNSQTQVSHALLLQRRVSSVLVAGS